MPDNVPILSFIVLIPLAGALMLLLLPKDRGRLARIAAIVFTGLSLLFAVWLYADYQPAFGGAKYEERAAWLSIPLNLEAGLRDQGVVSYRLAFDYHLGVDGISLPLVLLAGAVSLMAALGSVHIRKRRKAYYALLLLLQTGMYGVFLARDAGLFFIFFELTLIPMFFLIGIWGDYGREKAANRFLVYNGLGSAVMLLAFLLLVATLGFRADETADGTILTYSGNYDVMLANLSDPNAAANAGGALSFTGGLKWSVFVLLLVAFGIKVPIFPLHAWMLRVHAEAPPPVVMIHAGVLLKMGVYGLIRFAGFLLPAQLEAAAPAIAALGVINVLYGAILACVQKEFKLVLAYSSISHMGIVLLGLASLSEIGFAGALFQSVSHGLISALLFLVVGSLQERTGTTRLTELGGLARSLPFTSGILLTAGLAALGLPGLSGFVGELLAFLGLFATMRWPTVLGVLGVLLAAVYVLRSVLAIAYGPLPARFAGLKEARFTEALPMVALTGLIVLLGVYPSLLTDLMEHGFAGLLRELQTRAGG